MTKVVNVRFRDAGKAYRFTCDGMSLGIGDSVIVETEQGIDLAHVCEEPYDLESDGKEEILPIKRIANEADLKAYDEKCAKEKDAMVKCRELIAKRGLEMNLVDCAFTLDGKKVVFYFTADGRVDFRELVKDLAYAFHTRIELRQIGSRDQAKLVGGIGICGRELCCCSFLNHFAPVNLKLARQQGLSLNPGKLNGACGRLMCCLQFEKEAYEDAHNRLPEQGKRIRTPEGVGVVYDVNYIEETINVKFTSESETEIRKFSWEELEPLNPDIKPGCRNCPAKGCKNNNDDGNPEDGE
ncbi:MAG: stage 0 sporulation family protein [Clostridiales bacterium]|nr:stage 0 sporulation family protein [Clostridiales bacterium]